MQRKTPKLLEDIRGAAAFILEIAKNKSLADYQGDRTFRSAVERNFEIMGEAIRRLVREDLETAGHIGDYPQIIAFRNVLIHGYDLIDDERVWTTINKDLAPLVANVEALLRDEEKQT
ncbi:MAG: DUF86 domain-containing protein [Candidatus Hydrogenedentes bacterium]|nr:DUF86 domain-containing protein [Candidatus Hydrogenedentota bacterium]